MKNTISVTTKILNIISDISLITYLALINMECWDSLISAMTIVMAIKIFGVIFSAPKSESKYIAIAVALISTLIAFSIEFITMPDNVLAFVQYPIFLIISAIITFITVIISSIQNA